ncbi:increased DNA methylation 1-like [Andrographis paniculata]|uniref:increased DNA methylation 1-like n=1 Tax=Andrographis paniculata TaxID=175694 RepID=UPI0021E93B46|nr:increased DNA methylation 1-like [Andrographis paniculata]
MRLRSGLDAIDLKEDSVGTKRTKIEKKPARNWNVGSDDPPKSGRVLRSRTVAMSDGEKKEITLEIGNIDEDIDVSETSVLENTDDAEAPAVLEEEKPILKRGRGRPPKSAGKREATAPMIKRKKGKRGRPPKLGGQFKVKVNIEVSASSIPKRGRGRPPKVKVDSEVSSLSIPKRGRGRLPKTEVKSGIPSLPSKKEDDGEVTGQNVSMSGIGNDQDQGGKEHKRKRGWQKGRPRKVVSESIGLVTENNSAPSNTDSGKSEHEVSAKRLKVGEDAPGDCVKEQIQPAAEDAAGKTMGLREQKQLVRDQIVAMLKKAGWTIEYRQRQSRDYQDAVYVDRDGKTHWSVTLAYQKLKNKIDNGNGDDIDVCAFTPIPEETLSVLFKISKKDENGGQNKKLPGKRMKKESKSKPSDERGRKRRTLLARRPRDPSNSDGYQLYEGKRTLLSWMIDLGTVSLGWKVKYKKGKCKKILLEGMIFKEGICCDCCNIVYTVQGFDSHAKSTCGKPYENIYLDSGKSLSQCLVDTWGKHMELDNIQYALVDVEGDDPNDDTCNVCGDGGDLICCDSCPSTSHHGCLHIEVPTGDWHCEYCSCKFCGMACGITATADDCNALSELYICSLCEEKFHIHCTEVTSGSGIDDENPSFCGEECSKIFQQLQVLIGVRHELEEGFSYTILRHHPVNRDASADGNSFLVENNSKLAIAFNIMDECFEPIIDERSGINLIHNVVYSCGSNIKRLNYDGFYTFVLEKGDELLAVASIRIHGTPLAEMPFIGTRFIYRRQGLCRRLLTAIESVLQSLGVEKLVIPAISELNETWTKVFNFAPLEESTRLEMKHMSLVVFPGVAMLQKPLSNPQINSAAHANKVGNDHQNPPSDSKSGEAHCEKDSTQANLSNDSEDLSAPSSESGDGIPLKGDGGSHVGESK